MDIQEFFKSLPGPNRFLIILTFLLVILYFTYRNMKERAKSQEDLRQNLKKLRETVDKKELRIEETHHRLKNNLQIISYMLEKEADEFDERCWENKLRKCKARVNSIAMIHDLLSEPGNGNLIQVKPYFEQLVNKNSQLLSSVLSGVHVNTDIDEFTTDPETATACGLVINELMTNCFQHAFEESNAPKIDININRVNEHVELSVTDNGSGVSDSIWDEQPFSLGNDLVSNLVESDLKGKLDFNNSNRGTEVQIKFPAIKDSTGNVVN